MRIISVNIFEMKYLSSLRNAVYDGEVAVDELDVDRGEGIRSLRADVVDHLAQVNLYAKGVLALCAHSHHMRLVRLDELLQLGPVVLKL